MNTPLFRRTLAGCAALAALTLSFAAASGGPASAGTGAPNGSHYTLNIHGVPKDKTASMTGSDTRNIFVPLNGKTTINLSPGDFQVLDGNGTDGSASFQLPAPDPDGDGLTAYSVYVRALGKPGGSAKATSCVTDTTGTWCSTEQALIVRTSGKQSFTNVSKELLTVCLDTDGDGACDTRTSLFSDSSKSYLWSYDNTGLKLAQLRFYPVATDVSGI